MAASEAKVAPVWAELTPDRSGGIDQYQGRAISNCRWPDSAGPGLAPTGAPRFLKPQSLVDNIRGPQSAVETDLAMSDMFDLPRGPAAGMHHARDGRLLPDRGGCCGARLIHGSLSGDLFDWNPNASHLRNYSLI